MNNKAWLIALACTANCIGAFAAEPIIDPQDRPKASAAQSTRRPEAKPDDRRATDTSARTTGVEQVKVREIVAPEDRMRTRPTVSSLRSGVRPQDKPAEIVNPQDRPRQLLGPNNRSAGDKTTSRSLQSIEGGSVGVPNVTFGDVMASTRGRWRALAEELALGLAGNCVAQLTNPDRADPLMEEPQFGNGAAPTGVCPPLPTMRR
jgi:hypothetical protein